MAVISGNDARYEESPYVNQVFIGSAGGPASPSADGWPTYLLPVTASLVYKDSVEVDELRYPIRVYEQSLIPDTEGAGRHRGGFGCLVSYGPTDRPMTVAYSVEAHENPPKGVRGGLDGPPTQVWKEDAAGNRSEVPLVGAIELEPGERIVSTSSGGGGYGVPTDRDGDMVAEDVREGLVSVDRAKSVYGVSIDEDGQAGERSAAS
jgi:N-methylhydantoinase B